MANCYIHPCNRKAAEFLIRLGYKVTPGVKTWEHLCASDWGHRSHYCVLYVDFPGSGMALHKLLASNNLLFNEPVKPFLVERFDDQLRSFRVLTLATELSTQLTCLTKPYQNVK